MKTVTVSFRFLPEWRDELAAIAQVEGSDIGVVVRGLIADRLGRECGDRLSQLERRVSVVESKLKRLGE